jgi:cytochrome bd ubiquinol oxidase subunit I
MICNIDTSLVDWSRAQFALTAIYHWLFVPLTLGLSFIIAIMESIYVKTNNPEWKRITKFWMTLFGINFAIGIATGIILEFEFGTNWSNYSWLVGDIFGAPLAIEGIMAFFLETTFVAVMFFGWEKVSRKFHLTSTWLVAIGSNLSALWILVANAWMQYPVGMHFNPDSVRNEMFNFWDVLFSPVAINKFLHTVTSGYVLASVFVIGVSSWHIMQKKNILFAKRSIIIAAVFGLCSSVFLAYTGDGSAYEAAQKQPMKLAAMEGLYTGQKGAGLVTIGILKPGGETQTDNFILKIKIPKMLSLLGYRDANAFVPGIKDLVEGNEQENIMSCDAKIEKGKNAISALINYKKSVNLNNTDSTKKYLSILNENYKYFGYGYLENSKSIIPNISVTFYSFRIMVMMGFYLIVLFIVLLYFSIKNKLEKYRILLVISLISIPLVYLASVSGWLVTEFGRQPWVIQDILPTGAAVSHISTNSVVITFILFAIIFTALLIADIKIMLKQIKIGYKEGGNENV